MRRDDVSNSSSSSNERPWRHGTASRNGRRSAAGLPAATARQASIQRRPGPLHRPLASTTPARRINSKLKGASNRGMPRHVEDHIIRLETRTAKILTHQSLTYVACKLPHLSFYTANRHTHAVLLAIYS